MIPRSFALDEPRGQDSRGNIRYQVSFNTGISFHVLLIQLGHSRSFCRMRSQCLIPTWRKWRTAAETQWTVNLTTLHFMLGHAPVHTFIPWCPLQHAVSECFRCFSNAARRWEEYWAIAASAPLQRTQAAYLQFLWLHVALSTEIYASNAWRGTRESSCATKG